MDYSEALELFHQATDISPKKAFVIAFCGVFSSGKSSIINQLLNNEYKLPTGINPVTNVITRIRYGNQLGFYYFDGRMKKINSASEANKILSGDALLPNGCYDVLVTIPSPLLKNGIEILDTPGFEEEMGGKLERISREAVLSADMAILCTNALKLGDMFEKDYITTLSESINNFCLIVNRMDHLNTEKDRQDVLKRANELMHNKESKILKGFSENNVFLTVADGTFSTLGGFDSYIARIVTNETLKKRLSKLATAGISKYRLNNLLEAVSWETKNEEELLKQLEQKNQSIIKKKINDYNLQQIAIETKIKKAQGSVSVKLNSARSEIECVLTGIENNNERKSIATSEKYRIKQIAYTVAEEFDNFAESIDQKFDPNMKYIVKYIINKFTISSTKSIIDKLIPMLIEVFDLCFEEIRRNVTGESPSTGGCEREISEHIQRLNEWKQLKKKIDSCLNKGKIS